jgi:MFS family permease
MGIGMALVGIFNPAGIIMGLPEMEEASHGKYHKSQEQQVNYLSSGLFNAFLGMGQMAAPFFGSKLSASIGWRYTCDIVVLITLLYACLFLFVGGGASAFRKTCSNLTRSKTDEDFVKQKESNLSM